MYGNTRLYKVSRIKNYAMSENDHRIVMTLDAGGDELRLFGYPRMP